MKFEQVEFFGTNNEYFFVKNPTPITKNKVICRQCCKTCTAGEIKDGKVTCFECLYPAKYKT